MGLIKAAFSAIGTTLADQWKEYIYCDSMDGDTLVKKGEVRVTAGSNTNRTDNIITNGSKVAVNEGQFMLIVENGKVVDFTSEPGAYTYDTGTEPSLFDSGFSGLKESFKKVGKRFAYGGSAENDQRVYYVNIKEIMNNKVGVGDVPFRDSEFNFSMKLQGFGVYSYKITDPVMFYTNVCSNVTDSFKKSAIDEQLRTEVQNALQPALGRIALKRIAYDQLPLFTKEIAQEVNNELSEDWTQLRGISVVSVAFASIKPDDASAAKINQMQEARVYTNSQMQTGRATAAGATAMETAAGNPNGAMNAFMGMGMTNAFGANLTQATMQNNQQGAGIPVMPGAEGAVVGAGAVSGGWKCECGTQNTGKFCTECGKPMPAPAAGWTCECGTQNTGKFCTECGKPMPVASEEWTCECGNKNTGKFCTECGKPRS
ncbi:MAG TPA: virion core protein (lumpy skin disease virus) [Lachnospiraceae bacterium]|nr:virion core protein (lumpy skin disease virus) [Lachnospiraceae bacterium]